MSRKHFRQSGFGGSGPLGGVGYSTRKYGNRAEFQVFGRKMQENEERPWRGGDYGSMGHNLWPEKLLGDPGPGSRAHSNDVGYSTRKIWESCGIIVFWP